MRKQKLTRKSLDELAKIMPVLKEKEQRECIGRDRYYTFDGKNLGVVGDGNEIRMIEESIFDAFKGNGEMHLNCYTTDYSDGASSSQEAIMNSIASGMGISSIGFYSGPSNEGGKWNPTGGIQLNKNTKCFQSGCYHELTLFLYHEQFHLFQNIPDQTTKKQRAEYEVKAYEATMAHPSFSQTPLAFRAGIEASYREQKQLAGQ